MKFSTLFLVAFASIALAAPAQLDDVPELNGLDAWMANQYQVSLRRIDESMSQPGAAPGAVVAAPSKRDPDYYYFWVRDGSLTLDYIHHLLLTGNNPSQRERQLQDYSDLSRRLQTTSNPSGEADGNGIGEPKFNMDGTAFTGSWGRPQDDGPAIRGFVLARYANYLLKKGQDVNNLYRRELPARSVIKADLEYVSHKWRQTSFDIWEEVKGIHFYTRLVQRRAMVEGAALARRLGDAGAAEHYESQAREMQAQMERFWDARRRLLVTTIDRDGGLDYKQSQIDVQVVLGALHAASDDEYYSPTGDRVQATAARVIEAFRDLYNINKARRDLAPAIGRYPEDRYSGTDVSVAHAWVLATAGIGEMYYRAAVEYKKSGRAPITSNNVDFIGFAVRNQIKLSAGEMIRADDERFPTLIKALIKEGDLYMARIRYHTAADGNLHEQMHRDTGYMTGATHLTWSYVAFSTAHDARQQAIKLLKA